MGESAVRRRPARAETPKRSGESARSGTARSAEVPAPANPVWSQLALAGPLLQAKLRLGAADDPLEREADRVAEAVVSEPGPRPGAESAVPRVSAAPPALRRKYRLSEVQAAHGQSGNPVASSPDTYFYPGSAANTADRKALVVAGIHGDEASAIRLGSEFHGELQGGTFQPDFHSLVVPRANPTGGRGTSNVGDLNREYGGSSPSSEPIAANLETLVTEFQPERILSIHAIGSTRLGGLYLDPIRAPGTAMPPGGTPAERERVFTGDPRNRAAMDLTESLVDEARGVGRSGVTATAGNTPRTAFPASIHPAPAGGSGGTAASRSRHSLLYPLQSQVQTGAQGQTSLGVWASQLAWGPAVVTLEVPGNAVARGGSNWKPFLPAVRRFLRFAGGGRGSGGSGSGGGGGGSGSGGGSARPSERIQRAPAAIPAASAGAARTGRVGGRNAHVPAAAASRIASMRGGGEPLSPDARRYFEPRFGRDLSAVRLHTGGAAADAARDVGARAFSVGSDIGFAAGEYRPGTAEGRRLLAHELTHTVQQGSGRTLRRKELTEKDLGSQGTIPQSFVESVYTAQVGIWKKGGATYTHEVAKKDRKTLPSGDVMTGRTVSVHQDIADPLARLLAHARKDLASDQAAGTATDVSSLVVRSGYRSATEQMGIWEREFKKYYKATEADRQDPAQCPSGEHGPEAAELLARYINSRVFSPGYSPHQKGKTIDFTYKSATDWPKTGDNWAPADTGPAAIATWQASWFFRWLSAHAATYGFHQNPALNEPWHWEWRPPSPPAPGPIARLWLLILRILDLLLELLGLSRKDEEAPPPEEPEPKSDE